MTAYKIVHGNLLTSVTSGVLLHGCNTIGKMGAGLALGVKNRYPKAFREYRRRFEESGLDLGTVQFVEVADGLYVANAMTQESIHRSRGRGFERPPEQLVSLEALCSVFDSVAAFATEHNLTVSLPKIGSKRGGGSWEEIEPLMVKHLASKVPTTLYIYEG